MLLYDFQTAIFQKIKIESAAIEDEITVYDYYPDADENSFPFVIIDEIARSNNVEWSTRDSKVYNVTLKLDIWGGLHDKKKVLEIIERLEVYLSLDLTEKSRVFEFENIESLRVIRTQENFINGEMRFIYRVEA